jgi:acetyl-CoA carboxylase biotin carboxyl carrier protein
MEIKEIQNLIKFVAKSGAHEVKLETDDFKITIKANSEGHFSDSINSLQPVHPGVVPAPQMVPVKADQTSAEKSSEENTKENTNNLITIKSPMIGTFYRKSSPDKPLFVEVGDTIKEGDVLCVIEAMKLFNEIESEVNGKIVKILVDDSSPVEFDQPLFLVESA